MSSTNQLRSSSLCCGNSQCSLHAIIQVLIASNVYCMEQHLNTCIFSVRSDTEKDQSKQFNISVQVKRLKRLNNTTKSTNNLNSSN